MTSWCAANSTLNSNARKTMRDCQQRFIFTVTAMKLFILLEGASHAHALIAQRMVGALSCASVGD
jgi:hypothetical protein